MYKLGHIDQARYEQALQEPLNASYHGATPELEAPYIAEMARAEMVGRFGSNAYIDGYKVTTTVSANLQTAANQALRKGLTEYDTRHGYRGPETRLPGMAREAWLAELAKYRSIGDLEPAIVTQVEKSGILVMTRSGTEEALPWEGMKWARPFLNTNSLGPRPQQPADVTSPGDLVRIRRHEDGSLSLAQVPAAQAALVSLDPANGAIRALVGGYSFEQSNYNRATQAKRQPGSSFKPFIYSAALDKGYSAASMVNDAPIVFHEAGMKEAWRPKNDNNTFLGPIRLREALYKSRNLVSIRLLQSIGIDYALDYVGRFGFSRDNLPRNFSLALGTADLTPMEIATGWSVFANGGFRVQPYLIERIENRDGKVLFTANPASIPVPDTEPSTDPVQEEVATQSETAGIAPDESVEMSEPLIAERVIDPRTTYIMTSMLQDVIKRGTGRRALAMGRSDIAGKTGTTNESKDSWFSGYNADYVTTVWVGFDQPESLGRHEYGGTVALPIWMQFMSTALLDRPARLQAQPSGLVTLRIDPSTGRAAYPGSPSAYFELFKAENVPPPADETQSGFMPADPASPSAGTPIDLF
jgi:penicillin-binding protein 1A